VGAAGKWRREESREAFADEYSCVGFFDVRLFRVKFFPSTVSCSAVLFEFHGRQAFCSEPCATALGSR
jgi:hypothetical protein